jgi:hypothetical protein
MRAGAVQLYRSWDPLAALGGFSSFAHIVNPTHSGVVVADSPRHLGLSGTLWELSGVTSTASGRGLEKITRDHGGQRERPADRRLAAGGSGRAVGGDGDPTRIKAVFSFAGGGVFVEHDILPAGPPFTGTWARGDGGRFRATIWSGFPGEGPGSPGVAVRVRLVGRLEHRTISGTYTATVFDSTGAPVESNTGKFSGQPISA